MRYRKARLLVQKKDVESGVITVLYEFVIRARDEHKTLFDEVKSCTATRLVSGRLFDNTLYAGGIEWMGKEDYEIRIEINSTGSVPYGINGRKDQYVEEMVNHIHERLGEKHEEA